MAIWIGNRVEPVTRWDKALVWLRRFLIWAFIVWIGFSVQNYSEDSRSHAIKVSFPLLLGFGKIIYRTPDYDADKASWEPISSSVSISDGQIIFVRKGNSIYAVKIWNQTMAPEQAEYEYLKVGDSGSIVKSVTQPFPAGITLPALKIGWSGQQIGEGFIYMDKNFIWGLKSRYEIGAPFYTGDLESYRNDVPAEVHFEHLPWKIGDATARQ